MSLPHSQSEPEQPRRLKASLLIPARNSGHALERTVHEAHRYLAQRFPGSFEIMIIPNSRKVEGERDGSKELIDHLASKYGEVKLCHHTGPVGKGAAIRSGFFQSRGEWIFFTDADLPYELEFIGQASRELERGYHLVTGNRRLPESEFQLPVRLLSLAYSRHRLGLWFNQAVRALLPIVTTDTQAGIKALSRSLAETAFGKMTCPGFFFDLEIFLTCSGMKYGQRDLPVVLHLHSEKSTVRIIRQSVLAVYWLMRITVQHHMKRYRSKRVAPNEILPRFRGLPWRTKFFLQLRWRLTPYLEIASFLPQSGLILDLGCGHGLLAICLALESPLRKILAVDHDPIRIETARRSSVGLEQIEWREGMIDSLPLGHYSGITLIDVMHYFEPSLQNRILSQAFERLLPGGILLVREVEPNQGIGSLWNQAYERVATQIGFTRSQGKGLFFRNRQNWEKQLRSIGFEVSSHPCGSKLFADILYLCKKR